MRLSQRAQQVAPSATFQTAQRAQELQAAGIDVLNLSVGQPDFTTPTAIKSATIAAIQANKVDGYTATAGILPLRQAIVDRLSQTQQVTVTPQQVVVTTGAKMALYALFQVLLDPGDAVLLPAPYWVSYSEQVKLAGGQPIEVAPTADLKVTPAQLEAAVTPKTKAIVLNSPQNPSGLVYTPAELTALGDWAVAHQLIIVADEIYGELVYDRPTPVPSMLSLGDKIAAHTVMINGVSKTYAMTGWRIGYAVGQPDIISAMTTVLSHMTGNAAAVSQAAALAALTGDQTPVAEMKAAFQQRLDRIYPLLAAVPGFKLEHKPQGAFYLFPDVSAAMAMKGITTTSDFVAAVLNEAHVALVTGSAFGLPGHVRLSYAADLATLFSAIERLTKFMTTP
ncbi:pyridoxal phosphate-dependent aminotransferase [Levilactobacillus brevis]|uniref:pyridoxal phosphate-dependent aminotransferase n=1 Tax=Levilactobacillus brevis TaxID=1580 RepID=UPI000BE8A497|nr:pyridoxal phosphate-dependent aminotransferase [Levilactobacillus brevis]MCP9614461.1 pyridoxal phosphate-dependent aminotransferase [Levilactobacillus brevis]MCZ2119183.1 pyridoxal phosphate-dependent aminotransferase [Levilactobacillus brevis]MCZ2124677.1 pyridoxal phosphate-dependent aminotransferase [Levilactobacillus brevis]MCZ2208996.1 pyridoxal phosphate-dependent aminotransferase [Levilactobacillus brevis]MCZ2324455.1 pyridoxal phosphate-dependent aminotransferase [Levilactobacillus